MISKNRAAQNAPVMITTYQYVKTKNNSIHKNQSEIGCQSHQWEVFVYPFKHVSMVFIPCIWDIHAKDSSHQRIEG